MSRDMTVLDQPGDPQASDCPNQPAAQKGYNIAKQRTATLKGSVVSVEDLFGISKLQDLLLCIIAQVNDQDVIIQKLHADSQAQTAQLQSQNETIVQTRRISEASTKRLDVVFGPGVPDIDPEEVSDGDPEEGGERRESSKSEGRKTLQGFANRDELDALTNEFKSVKDELDARMNDTSISVVGRLDALEVSVRDAVSAQQISDISDCVTAFESRLRAQAAELVKIAGYSQSLPDSLQLINQVRSDCAKNATACKQLEDRLDTTLEAICTPEQRRSLQTICTKEESQTICTPVQRKLASHSSGGFPRQEIDLHPRTLDFSEEQSKGKDPLTGGGDSEDFSLASTTISSADPTPKIGGPLRSDVYGVVSRLEAEFRALSATVESVNLRTLGDREIADVRRLTRDNNETRDQLKSFLLDQKTNASSTTRCLSCFDKKNPDPGGNTVGLDGKFYRRKLTMETPEVCWRLFDSPGLPLSPVDKTSRRACSRSGSPTRDSALTKGAVGTISEKQIALPRSPAEVDRWARKSAKTRSLAALTSHKDALRS